MITNRANISKTLLMCPAAATVRTVFAFAAVNSSLTDEKKVFANQTS